MPRIPDYDKKHKHNDEYIFIDTTSDYKINLLDAKLEEHEKHPFKNAEKVDEVSENDYTIMEGENNTPKKVLASAFINSVIDDSEVIDDMKDNIDNLENGVNTLENNIAELETDIAGIEGNITSLENGIVNLENQIATLKMDGGEIS